MEEKETNQQQAAAKDTERNPNDIGLVGVEGHIKIFNPETGEILVEKRA